MSASAIIADVRALLAGDPVFLTGSLVAEETYGKTNAHSDVDLFCPTSQVLIATGQKLLDSGYTFGDRFDRVWARWLRYGFKTWHTNSLRLMAPNGMETNLVYKLSDGHPTTSLAQVIESFDFGLLAVGYDLERNSYHDMRSYLFPGMDPDGPLPMMPNKRMNWRNGFISQYNGLRECGRYAKYHRYGYDLSLVKDDLTEGYYSAAAYFSTHFDADKKQLGLIYEVIGQHIEMDNLDQLELAAKQINYSDSLDVIMAALE
jgi:hypothetical protein